MMYINEGTNTDIVVEFNKLKLSMVKDKIAFNAALLNNDYKKAREIAYRITANCELFYKKLDNTDITVTEALVGTTAKMVKDMAMLIGGLFLAIEGGMKAVEVVKGQNLKKSEKKMVRKAAYDSVSKGNAKEQAIGLVLSGAFNSVLKICASIIAKVSNGKNVSISDLNSYYVEIRNKMKVLCVKSKMLINEVDVLEKRYGASEKKEELEKELKDAKNVFKESEDNNRVSKPWFIKASDNSINACVKIKGYDKPFRARSSMLIIKDIDTVPKVYFSYSDKDKEYHAPGGGWNEKEEPMKAAMREAKEECHINVKIVKPFGERLEYYDEVRDWVKDHVDNPNDYWYGYYSKIFVGQFGSEYNGHVNDEDEDPEINSGKFYNFEDIKDKIYPEYKKAIEDYLSYWNKTVKESEELIVDKDLMDIALESFDDIMIDDIYTTETFSNPIRKFKDKIEEIKEAKPGQSDTPDSVKEFVDKYYDDIVKASKVLEKEPDKLTKSDIIDAIGYVVAYIGGYGVIIAGLSAGTVPAIILSIIGAGLIIVASIVSMVITWVRRNNDVTVVKNLTKIKAALQKLDTKKLPADTKKKVEKLIEKINDAETDIYAKFKNVKESTKVDPEILAIYEACQAGTITEDQREELIENIKANRVASIAIEEAVSDEDNSLKEKYAEVRRLVYEKCANGEFSEDAREDILKAAYNKIFNIEESDDSMSQVTPANKANDDADTKKALDEMNKKIEKAVPDAQ